MPAVKAFISSLPLFLPLPLPFPLPTGIYKGLPTPLLLHSPPPQHSVPLSSPLVLGFAVADPIYLLAHSLHLFRSLFHRQMSSAMRASALFVLLLVVSLFQGSMATRKLEALVEPQPTTLTYHNGHLLTGPIAISLVWYGKFTPTQRAIVADFVSSLSSPTAGKPAGPSVATWWKTAESYYALSKSPLPVLSLGEQVLDESYSLGRSLTSAQLRALAARGGQRRAVNVVLTAEDVAVEGFCMSRCGTHGASPRSKNGRFAFVWVGNSASQCPGLCAWPFHQPLYGPQTPPLVAPNGDVGVDGMVINLASMLAATFTNPFGNGFYQGPRDAPLEAASACPGVYGKNAYPGYAGDLLVDRTTGASYNANGLDGRRYLLPALVDPATSSCSTLV